MIDVIIPTAGNKRVKKAINSTDPKECRIICVQNGGSQHFVGDVLEEWGGEFTLESIPEPIGFVQACNIGWSLAQSDIVCCLNDDVTGKPDWASLLAKRIDSDSHLMQVGAELKQLHNNGACHGGRATDHFFISGWCFAVYRHSIGREHLFDPLFINGYCEDVDLSIYLSSKCWSIDEVAVDLHHEKHQTYEGVTPNTWYWKRNREYLLRKWNIT